MRNSQYSEEQIIRIMWTGPMEIDTSASQYLCNKMKGDDDERTAQGV